MSEQGDKMLALLVAQAEGQGAGAVTLRALVLGMSVRLGLREMLK